MDKEIQKELLNKTGDFINQAAHTLGATAQHVYEVLVRQQFVEGIGTLLGIGSFVVIMLVSTVMYTSIFKKKWGEMDSEAQTGVVVLGGIGFIILAFVLSITMTFVAEAIQKMINPEFYAIKFIFESVKK